MHGGRRRAGPDLTGDGHRVIDRYRETLSARAHLEVHRGRGDNADDLPGAVHQRSAGVARPHVGGNLDQPVDFFRAARQRVLGVDGPVERGHRAGLVGEGSPDTAGIAETDGRFADHDLTGVADGCRRQPARATKLEHCDVVRAVIANEVGRVVAPADGACDGVGARDDVVVRQHDAAGIDDSSGSGADRLLVVDLGRDLDDGRLDRRSGRRCICRSRHRCRRRDQREYRGERDQQRGQPAAQERYAHVPIVPELRAAEYLTACCHRRAPSRTRSTMRSPNCLSTASPVSKSLAFNGAISVSRSSPASVSGRNSPRAMPRSTTGRNALIRPAQNAWRASW